MRRRSTFPLALALLAVVTAAGGATFAFLTGRGTTTVVRSVTVKGSPIASTASPLSVSQVYRKAYRGVVEIVVTTTQSSPTPFGLQSQTQQAQGSGFVVDGNGDIVTNQHVVDGARSITVRFWNGARYSAKL